MYLNDGSSWLKSPIDDIHRPSSDTYFFLCIIKNMNFAFCFWICVLLDRNFSLTLCILQSMSHTYSPSAITEFIQHFTSLVTRQIAFESAIILSSFWVFSLSRFNCLDTYKFYLLLCVAFVSKFYFCEISRQRLIVSEIQLRLNAFTFASESDSFQCVVSTCYRVF